MNPGPKWGLKRENAPQARGVLFSQRSWNVAYFFFVFFAFLGAFFVAISFSLSRPLAAAGGTEHAGQNLIYRSTAQMSIILTRFITRGSIANDR